MVAEALPPCDEQESYLYLCTADGTIDRPPSMGQFRNPQAVSVTSAEFTPFAIVANGTDASTIEVTVSEPAIAVIVTNGFGTRPDLDGTSIASSTEEITLYDDGTHGDRIPNDNIWSRSNFTYDSANISPGSLWSFRLYHVKVTTGAGTETIDLSGLHTMRIIYISPDELITPVNDVANSMQVAPHAYNNYKIGREDELNSSESEAMKEIGKDLFTYLNGDDVDFMLVFPTIYLANGASGRAYPVQNSVENIGSSIYDSSSNYGSPGQLKKAIVMNFSSTNGPTLHELAHQWGAYGLSGLGFHSCGYGGHWGTAGLGNGQLGGFDPDTLVDNGNGTFTVGRFGSFANGGDGVVYAQLEKYLIGMIPSSQVDPIKVPVNLDCDSFVYTQTDVTFKADSIRTVTIEEIKTELGGERNPSSAISQKSFKAAYVAVSDKPLTAAELSYFNSRAKILTGEIDSSFLNSFPDATGNVGSIDATTKAPPPAAPGPIEINITQIEPVAPQPGDSVTLTVQVENSGTTPAESVMLTATVPSDVTFVNATAAVGVTVTQNLPNVLFDLGTVSPGTPASIKLIYAIPSSLTGSATLTSQFTADGDSVSDQAEHSILLNAKLIYLPVIVR